jgi:hypothetical protein
VRQQDEVERWRQRGYEAVDQRVEKLREEIGEQDFEAISDLLGREGRRLKGALFEEVLKSRGAKGRGQDTHICEDCGRPEAVAYQEGGKPVWGGEDGKFRQPASTPVRWVTPWVFHQETL